MLRTGIRLAMAILASSSPVYGKKTNQPVYQEGFDLAAGGSSLTRASRDGLVFSNPALLPLGSSWFRWVGSQFSVQGSRQLAGSANPSQGELLNQAWHVGQSVTTGWLGKYFGIMSFQSLSADLSAQAYGDGGLPQLAIDVEAYAGGLVSLASRPFSWLTLGVSMKYLQVAEPYIEIPLLDPSQLQTIIDDPNSLRDQLNFGSGVGADLGALVWFQGYHVDYSLALKVDDFGGTKLDGREPFKQVQSIGLGLAIHNTTDVIHLSLDYRDIGDVYEEATFKKIYIGAKLQLRNRLGFAVGLYQGLPTYGVKLDLPFFKFGLSAYSKELGSYPGQRQRDLYHASFAFGF